MADNIAKELFDHENTFRNQNTPLTTHREIHKCSFDRISELQSRSITTTGIEVVLDSIYGKIISILKNIVFNK